MNSQSVADIRDVIRELHAARLQLAHGALNVIAAEGNVARARSRGLLGGVGFHAFRGIALPF